MARQANQPKTTIPELRTQILSDFAALSIPLRAEQFDAALARAEREGLSHLEFLRQLIGEQAGQRRERSIARRIRAACFREEKTLATFDWQFNAKTIKLLIIDEFGFEWIERTESPQAANLLYKVIDARCERRSTALVTNIDFKGWAEYLGDTHLCMGLLDRIVDGAIILKMPGKSYRAHRAKQAQAEQPSDE